MKGLEYHRTIIGYHGCDASLVDAVLRGERDLEPSKNSYDWLGSGIYFWEHGPARAQEWAEQTAQREPEKVKTPAVVGALIHLGNCFDLLDTENTNALRESFSQAIEDWQAANPGQPLPENKGKDLMGRCDRRHHPCPTAWRKARAVTKAMAF